MASEALRSSIKSFLERHPEISSSAFGRMSARNGCLYKDVVVSGRKVRPETERAVMTWMLRYESGDITLPVDGRTCRKDRTQKPPLPERVEPTREELLARIDRYVPKPSPPRPWCAQCDRCVTLAEAAACSSRWCKVK